MTHDSAFERLVATVGNRDHAQQIVDQIAPAGLTAEDALAAIAAFDLHPRIAGGAA
jgi:hypothetical protein